MQLLQERRATQLLPLWQRSTATTRCRSIRRLRDLEDNDIPNHEENQDVVGSAVLAAGSPALQHETEKGSSTTRNPLVRQEAPPENSQISVTEGGSYLDDCDEGTNDEHGTQLGEVWAYGCAGDFENDGEEDPESGVNCLHSEPKGCRSATTEGNPEELTAEENGVW
ncbi:hypothetical protein TGME49_297660 [Toxoplasma gondii ME49]|uniref:Uncharacterized protein n=1 Tax=Toxoplasma gondii (strain ATCC 50611 / Me49) TaxID=508771 RepID=S8F8E1_TOXGM|nr:hypothetical protein TGME49_297660 [Toxoplasma gondii ME49]EPT32181.1 hypothetical protein TGME49_297660 [Toxoplasma gondii ME49]|eukprot:XP_002371186.1 hypothetical protein TGME49_297660 [Toxoplasma gondii ME49]